MEDILERKTNAKCGKAPPVRSVVDFFPTTRYPLAPKTAAQYIIARSRKHQTEIHGNVVTKKNLLRNVSEQQQRPR